MSNRIKQRWTIATARQNLPRLIDLAVREPQEVYRRNTLVARVIGPGDPGDLKRRRPLTEALAELRQICIEEQYALQAPRRSDRRNPFSRGRK